jgi:hypothetical protein
VPSHRPSGGQAQRPGGSPYQRPGGGGTANRPGGGGSGTQWRPGNNNRPNWANRPGGGGSGTQWRPGNNNRPNWANRPGGGGSGTQGAGSGNRAAFANRSNTNNIFNRQTNIANNRVTNINQNNFNSVNRPWGYNNYHANWSDWHAGHWDNWHSCPSAWFGAGAATAAAGNWLFSPGESYAYSNPFYEQPATYVADSSLDYSQPIAVPAPAGSYVDTTGYADDQPEPQAAEAAPADQPAATQAPPEVDRDFEKARAAFKGGDYATALQLIDDAIKGLPGDTTLHEFRALVLFAQKKYKDAAAGVYAVLSAGPGMTWATMSGLYPSLEPYEKQLRALEAYQRDHPHAPDGHFLLAYHYLVLEYTDQAVKQLELFSKLVPDDKLAPELIKAFTQKPDNGKPKAETK